MHETVVEPDRVLEECTECGHETPHSVSIEILQEGTDQRPTAYSREPYRVTECDRCGSTEQLRMNNQ
jgi:uncharacterized Zn finger protein